MTSAQTTDRQSYTDYLLRRQQEEYESQHQERMREHHLRAFYQGATDAQIEEQLSRYCPVGKQRCTSIPPDLAEEGIRRGLLTAPPPSPDSPHFGCVTMGVGMGGGITDCQ
jgi:hypothetical protein